MKLGFYDDFKLGLIQDGGVVDLSKAAGFISHTSPQDLMRQLIEGFADHKPHLEEASTQGTAVPLSQVRLRPPLPSPHNTVCMAVNYMEDGTRDAPAPINAFHKSPNCVIGEGDTMILPDIAATIFEGEAEMALVIGKHAENVKAEDAFDYIFGYTNFIDMSARGLVPFYQMKSRATFAPLGPWLVTADEISDPQNLQIKLSVNGEVKQSFNTNDMAHKIPRIIEWVSSIHPLEPGDVVATGTNHRGLSALQDGDRIELEVEGLGALHIGVRDDLKRAWPRETRLERADRGLDGTAPQTSGKYAPA